MLLSVRACPGGKCILRTRKKGTYIGPIYDQSIIKVYMQNKEWSQNIISLIEKHFANSGGVFCDIGANIGLISIPISKNRNIKVISFEPDSDNFSLLKANVAINNVDVDIRNISISDKNGTEKFNRSKYNSVDHRLSNNGKDVVEVCTLDSLNIDKICEKNSQKLIVKIDTQGAEPLIFRGGMRTLASASLIVTEFWPWGMRRMGLEPTSVIEFVREKFSHGIIISEPPAPPRVLPIEDIVSEMESLSSRGGELDDADVAFFRP